MELMNCKLSFLMISSEHPRFKVYRRIVHTSMNPRAVERYNVIFDEERHILLRDLATEPEAFLKHIRRYVT
jgi:cytochrome P450